MGKGELCEFCLFLLWSGAKLTERLFMWVKFSEETLLTKLDWKKINNLLGKRSDAAWVNLYHLNLKNEKSV